MMAKLRGMKDSNHTEYLIRKFQLDPSGKLKRMSLGMKRKLAIVTAFMHDPSILILDEPTSGLDPIMQQIFTEHIKEEKEKGKTILISSHIFSEIDATCDRISIIKEGRIISDFVADDLRNNQNKRFKVQLGSEHELHKLFREVKENKINQFLMLNIGLFLLIFALSGISFFFSSLFNLFKNSIAFGAGIPIVFFLFSMMSTMSASLENFRYITINTFFDREAILMDNNFGIGFIILAIIRITLYIIGIEIFKKKDLPL